MDWKELAQKVKAKFPQSAYIKMSDWDLAQKVLAKFPDAYPDARSSLEEYSPQQETSPLHAAGAALKATGRDIGLATAKTLPVVGAIAGGVAGSPGGVLGSAAGAGIGAAGGEAIKQVAERAMGEDAPETAEEAARGIEKVGLAAALTDLGVGAAVRSTLAIAPTILQTFSKLPAEAIKRAIQRPFLIPLRGNAAQASVQRNGMRALRNVQEYVNATAKDTGENVGLALEDLHAKTKGAPVFDFQEAVDIGEAGLKDLQASDPAVAKALGPSIKKLQDILAGFRATGKATGVMGVSAKVARARIRALDELVSYSSGGVRQVESDAVGKVIKNMRHALNEEMKDVAATTGYTKLAEANSAHSAVMNAIDELGGVFRTRTLGTEDLVNKFRRLESKFNRGGVDTEVFQELATKFPAVQKSMEDLLDNAAAMTFTRLPQGTPSGFMKDSFRVLTHPRLVGAVIKGSQGLAPGGAGIAAGVSMQKRYEKPTP